MKWYLNDTEIIYPLKEIKFTLISMNNRSDFPKVKCVKKVTDVQGVYGVKNDFKISHCFVRLEYSEHVECENVWRKFTASISKE